MTPSQPLPDRRLNRELSSEEVSDEIAKRDASRKRTRIQTITGLAMGGVGLAIGASAGLITENIWMAILGFSIALIGFGFTSPKEAVSLVRSILGKGGSSE